MIPLPSNPHPLADLPDHLRGIQEYMTRRTDPWVALAFWAVVLALATAFLIATARYYRRPDERRRADRGLHPWRLFLALLWQLPLTFAQRWTLIRLARRSRPDCPAAILMSPGALRAAGLAWAGGQEPLLWNSRLGHRLAPIALTLFAHPLGPQ